MSITQITYLDRIIPNQLMVFSNPSYEFIDSLEFSKLKYFIDSLESDKAYVVTFEFIISWLTYEEDSPLITLSKPILLTRNSSPILLSNFLYHQIGLAIRDYNLEDEILDLMEQAEGPGVIIKYNPINLFN